MRGPNGRSRLIALVAGQLLASSNVTAMLTRGEMVTGRRRKKDPAPTPGLDPVSDYADLGMPEPEIPSFLQAQIQDAVVVAGYIARLAVLEDASLTVKENQDAPDGLPY